MNKLLASALVACAAGTHPLAAPTSARTISFEERLAAQTAIEQVYWNHRTWPKANSSPKPPLSAVLPEAALRARVDAYLAESNALDKLWHRPITADALQAELDRIVRDSHDPGMLREIFAALGNDAALIAETLARQTLADRLVRSWYAHDDRFQGDLNKRAEAALAACGDAGCMKSMGGRYLEVTWTRGAGVRGVAVDDREWKRLVDRFAGRARGRPGRLEDTAEALSVDAVVGETSDTLTVATVVWDKRPFDAWWNAEARSFGSAIDAPAGAYSLGASSAGPCAVDTWDETPYGLEPRSRPTAVWTGAEMIVWGGGYNSGGRYNPATDTWQHTSRGANVPSARSRHTAVWTGSEMIVWGGDTTNAYYTDRTSDTGGRYNPASDTWLPTSRVNVPVSRNAHTAVWTGSKMVVWGGVDAAQICLGSGGSYDPASDSWVALPPNFAPSPRTDHTAVWAGDQMIVWGGRDNLAPGQLATGGRYFPLTNSWLPVSTSGVPSARYSHTAIWTGTEMIVWGGISSVYEQTGGRYRPATDSWQPTSIGANVPLYRYGHTAVWTGSRMVIWGGGNNDPDPLDSGASYDSATDAWVTISSGPSGRIYHSAVWTGSEMIVWGGQDYYGTLNTGGRYAPSTNSWVATAIDFHGEPTERRGQTAVWTGAEMIVWGGFDGNFVPLGTGGRYRPATDVWLPVSTGSNVPAARGDHTAVWTGAEMIVWGGLVVSASTLAPVNTGARYDPSTDSWQTTQRGAHVASARSGHVAVWSGGEMIVWGGRDSSVLGDGARFNPATGKWATMSSGGAPAARANATAVWTEAEMIVWGGDGASGVLNSGGRYAPAGNTWQAVSQGANVPSARSGHTAVWTGSRMIVWGGNEQAGSTAQQVNTGGRYDPASDAWLATSLIGDDVPSPRKEHSAVWTGTEMIVWGGGIDGPDNSGVRFTDTGSRYNPSNDAWLASSAGADSPIRRGEQSAVWTGTEMIVWGGTISSNASAWTLLNSGARYCADSCAVPATLYQDVDGDGYGVANVTQVTCAHPAGWAGVAGDCNDANPSIHPGAAEVCNSLDDDCDGVTDGPDTDGDGRPAACDDCPVDFDPDQPDFDHDGQGDLCDLDDGVIYFGPTDKAHVKWQPEVGPDHWNLYEGDLAVLKATGVYTQAPGSNALANRRCGLIDTSADDLVDVPSGAVKFALVTGVTGGVEGSLGTNSAGAPRPNSNPCP